MYYLLRSLVRIVSFILRVDFHEDFSLTRSLSNLYIEDIEAYGSGFVIGSKKRNIALYVVSYESIKSKNIGGRWN